MHCLLFRCIVLFLDFKLQYREVSISSYVRYALSAIYWISHSVAHTIPFIVDNGYFRDVIQLNFALIICHLTRMLQGTPFLTGIDQPAVLRGVSLLFFLSSASVLARLFPPSIYSKSFSRSLTPASLSSIFFFFAPLRPDGSLPFESRKPNLNYQLDVTRRHAFVR